jgi:hypothetical protein
MIEAAANVILQADNNDPETPPPTVGPKWLQRWLLRHPQYKRCQPELVVELRNYGEGQRYGEILQDSAIGDPSAH